MGKINRLKSANFNYVKSSEEKKEKITQIIELIMNDYINKNYPKKSTIDEGRKGYE